LTAFYKAITLVALVCFNSRLQRSAVLPAPLQQTTTVTNSSYNMKLLYLTF